MPKGYPANFSHQDTGCVVSPSCLACPRSICIHDEPGGTGMAQRRDHDQKRVEVMVNEGLTIQQAADRFGITERAMYRIKQRKQRWEAR
jgi:hypothetical protein